MDARRAAVVIAAVWLVAIFGRPPAADAQIGGSGSIEGTVRDASGGVLPGAAVTATNLATNVSTTRPTNGAGVFVLSPLAPGEYKFAVTLDGFKTFVQERVVVDALAVVAINPSLQVGNVAQEVTVTASALPLSTADARLGQTIRNEVYTKLPLVMNTGAPRDPTSFMFLMPGVQSAGRWGNVMGGQDFTTDTYVEGVPITNSVTQGEGRNLSYGISVEAIDQFQVETSGTAVMYNGQGASNYVVKSGTNKRHASAFEFFRNKALDSRSFFAKNKPDDNQSEFGGTAGGPIKQNRLFYFVAYDGYRDRRQTPTSLVSIPTLAMRDGDFSALPVTIYDPATTRPNPNGTGYIRDPFPHNIIPYDRISPVSRYLQSFMPAPTGAGLQNNFLGGSFPTGFNNWNVTMKIDWRASAAHQVSILVARGNRSQATPYRGGGNPQTFLPLPYTETRLVQETPTTALVKHTYVIRSSMLNQFSFGFSRLAVPIANATLDGLYPQKAGLVGLPPGEADSSFPEISFSGPNSPAMWRGTDARAFSEWLNNYTLQDNFQWVRGKHAITFGFQGQRLDADERERTYGSLATFGFSNAQTAGFSPSGTLLTNTGNAYASFLLGELNATNVIQDSQVATSGRFYNYAWWAQDDYKATDRLTLNLGLRYDLMKPYTEVYDRWSFMNPTLPNPIANGYPGAIEFAGYGDDSCQCRTPIHTYHGALGPRAGAAFELTRRLVLRGAYGIMYSRRGAVGGRAGARNGTGTLGFSASPSFPSPDGFTPAYNWNTGVPSYAKPPFFDPGLNAGFTTARRTGGSVTYGDPDIGGRPPRYQNWNAGFQYALSPTTTVGVTYAASHGDFLGGSGRGFYSNQLDPKYLALGNLLLQRAAPGTVAAAQAILPGVHLPYPSFSGTIAQMLRPFPQYSGVSDVYGDVASSNYRSLQFTVEQRRFHGLLVNFNYTYSHSEDNFSSRSGYLIDQDWAVSANDQPHVVNAIVVYDVTAGAGNRVLHILASGWQLSSITRFRSGRPLGPIGAPCNLPNAGSCYADFNPNFSGPVRINGDFGSGDVLGANPPSFLDRNAFATPAAYTFGDTSRTMTYELRNPHSWNEDLGVRRTFATGRGTRVTVGAEIFNVFDTVVFGGIQTNISNASFGRVSSQANAPRTGQLTVRFEF